MSGIVGKTLITEKPQQSVIIDLPDKRSIQVGMHDLIPCSNGEPGYELREGAHFHLFPPAKEQPKPKEAPVFVPESIMQRIAQT
jgi:hypothetical protein